MTNEIICYGHPVRTRNCQQEWYETAARTARKRAMGLRKLGFKVAVSGMGNQVTSVGRVNMTMLTIFLTPEQNEAGVEIPNPERIELN
jgi:hypothetical protein